MNPDDYITGTFDSNNPSNQEEEDKPNPKGLQECMDYAKDTGDFEPLENAIFENEKSNKLQPLLVAVSLENMERLLEWNVSHNHTKRWGCIKGKHSCTYSFMHEDKNEVLKWLVENYH